MCFKINESTKEGIQSSLKVHRPDHYYFCTVLSLDYWTTAGVNRNNLQICPTVDRITDYRSIFYIFHRHHFLKKDRDRRFLDRSRFASSSSSGATTLIFDRQCGVLIRVVSTVIVDFDN